MDENADQDGLASEACLQPSREELWHTPVEEYNSEKEEEDRRKPRLR